MVKIGNLSSFPSSRLLIRIISITRIIRNFNFSYTKVGFFKGDRLFVDLYWSSACICFLSYCRRNVKKTLCFIVSSLSLKVNS